MEGMNYLRACKALWPFSFLSYISDFEPARNPCTHQIWLTFGKPDQSCWKRRIMKSNGAISVLVNSRICACWKLVLLVSTKTREPNIMQAYSSKYVTKHPLRPRWNDKKGSTRKSVLVSECKIHLRRSDTSRIFRRKYRGTVQNRGRDKLTNIKKYLGAPTITFCIQVFSSPPTNIGHSSLELFHLPFPPCLCQL